MRQPFAALAHNNMAVIRATYLSHPLSQRRHTDFAGNGHNCRQRDIKESIVVSLQAYSVSPLPYKRLVACEKDTSAVKRSVCVSIDTRRDTAQARAGFAKLDIHTKPTKIACQRASCLHHDVAPASAPAASVTSVCGISLWRRDSRSPCHTKSPGRPYACVCV